MIRKESDGIHWLEFELLADSINLVHRVFLRHGGYSAGFYSSLNLGTYMGDDNANVQANILKISKLLDISRITDCRQCHGKEVVEITPDNYQSIRPADGFVTKHQRLGLKVCHADCQAGIFYDPIRHVVANVHCGWRGNVHNIYAETVAFMERKYRSNPANILVGISPSLGPERSEFINFRQEFPEPFWDFQYKPNYFNLWSISEMQLIDAGILPHHIQIAGISTYANPDDYFSYRRSKTTGCHGTVVFLK